MKIQLKRTCFKPTCTIGELFIDGKHDCWTLEDQVREPGVKVWGATAIPAGTYELKLEWSRKFGRLMLFLQDVPNFTGVQIHWGNDERDTHGCILVGKHADKINGVISASITCELCKNSDDRWSCMHAAFNPLFRKISGACSKGSTCITITDEPAEPPPRG